MANPQSEPNEKLANTLRQVIGLFDKAHRSQVVAELRDHLDAALDPKISVAFMGPFKTGKSALVNSLLNVEICPSHPDKTSRTTLKISYGADFSLHHRRNGEVKDLDVGDLGEALWGDDNGLLDATAPRALLELGIALIDVPGIVGPGSQEHEVALEIATRSDAVVWVGSAGRELTASDLSLLRSLQSVCPQVVVVLAKADLYAEPAVIQERNTVLLSSLEREPSQTLASSKLRQAALQRGDTELDTASGVPALVSIIARTLFPTAKSTKAERIAGQALVAIQQERWRLDRAAEALREPGEAERQLRSAQERFQQARTTGARWRADLRDYFNEAGAKSAADLKDRLTVALHEIEREIDSVDPRKALGEIEKGLHQDVRQAIIENHEIVVQTIKEATDRAASRFQAELRDVDNILGFDPAESALAATESELSVELSAGSVVELGLRTVRGAYMPSILFSALASTVGIGATVLTGGLVAVAAAALGGRAYVQEKNRQLRSQRQEAKAAVREYLEETARIARRAVNDGISTVHQAIADRFVEFTNELESSASDALYQAKRAAQIDQLRRNRQLADTETLRQSIARATATIETLARPRSP